MTYVPDVTVELAFGDGYSTTDAARTWVDVSDYVEADQGIDITFGRGDELSTADANTLSLTFDNTDGRFTAGLATGDYYPDVRIGVPIRVTTTPVDGTPSVRFVGFVDEWPVAWGGTDSYASATISATSRLARLGLNAELRPIIEQTYALDSPVAHYPLSEAAHATQAADISGNGAHALRVRGGGADVAFGVATGPGTDGLTAVAFAGGQWLRTMGGTPSLGTFSMFVLSTSDGTLLSSELLTPLTYSAFSLTIVGTTLTATSLATNGNSAALTGTLTPDVTHHVAFSFGSTQRLYIDGVQVDSDSLSGSVPFGTSHFGRGWTGTMSHVGFFSSALSAGQIADQAASGLTGFDGETTDDRLTRYASFAGVPLTEISTEAGSTGCAHVDTTGGSAVDLMRQVETTEGGVLFDAADGTLTFQNRAHRYARAADLTLDMAAQRVGADFSPMLDRTGLLNDVTASDVLGAVTARSIDTSSRDYYGPAATSVETLSSDDDEPEQLAAWMVATRAEPISRVPTLTVDLLTFTSAPSQDDVLAVTIGARVDVTGQPAQAADASATYFVEGYTETITGATYDLTFNVSPGRTWSNIAIFDDAARGFDSGVVFAY